MYCLNKIWAKHLTILSYLTYNPLIFHYMEIFYASFKHNCPLQIPLKAFTVRGMSSHNRLATERSPYLLQVSYSLFSQRRWRLVSSQVINIVAFMKCVSNGPPRLSICHQMAVHKRTKMLMHCNSKQNTWLCSKQSSFFSFYALPSGGKSKDVVVH